MAEKRKLSATRRTVLGKQVGQLRRDGQLPAVIYGPGVEPMAIQLNAREAARELRYVQGAELVELSIDGQVRNVLLQDLQRDSLRGSFLHADFYAVDMSRTLRARIPVRLAGTSFAVVSLSGVLVRGLTEIEVESLPGDLVPFIEADLSVLKEIGQAIHVRDLPLPPALTLLTSPDELIARVTAAQAEELAPVAAPTTAEVEVIEKGKEEEEGEEEE
jgi:large subunit ribosomal protein L25